MSQAAINTRQFLDPSSLAPLSASLSVSTILGPAPCSARFTAGPSIIRDPASFADFEVADVNTLSEGLMQVRYGNFPIAPFVDCNDKLQCHYYEDEHRHVKGYEFVNAMCVLMKCYPWEMFGKYAAAKVQGYELAIIRAIRQTLEANFLLVLEEMQYTALLGDEKLTRWHLDQLMDALEGAVFNLSGLCGVSPQCQLGPTTIGQRLANYMRSKQGRVQPVTTLLVDNAVEKFTGIEFTADLTGQILPNRGAVAANGGALSENIRNVRVADHEMTKRFVTTCFYGIFEQAPTISNTEPFRYANTEETIQLKYGPHVVAIADALQSSGRFNEDGTWNVGRLNGKNISEVFGEKIETSDNQLRTLLENAINYDPLFSIAVSDQGVVTAKGPNTVAEVKGLTKAHVLKAANQILNNIKKDLFANNPAGYKAALEAGFGDELVSLGLGTAVPEAKEGEAKFSGEHMKENSDYCCNDGCRYDVTLIKRAESLTKDILSALNGAGASKTVIRYIGKIVSTINKESDVIVRAIALLAAYVNIMGADDQTVKKIHDGILDRIKDVRTMLEENRKNAKYIFAVDAAKSKFDKLEGARKAIVLSFAAGKTYEDAKIDKTTDVKDKLTLFTETLENLVGGVPLKVSGLDKYAANPDLLADGAFGSDATKDPVQIIARAYLRAPLANLDNVMTLVNNNIPLPFGVGYLGEVVSENSVLVGWNPTEFTARLHNEYILQSKFEEDECSRLKTTFYMKSGFIGDPERVAFTNKAMMIELMDGAGHGWVNGPQDRIDARNTPLDVDRYSLMGFIYGLDATEEISKGRFDLTGFFRYFNKRIPTHKQQSVPSNKPHWSGAAFLANVLEMFNDDGKALGAQTIKERHTYTQKNLRATQTKNPEGIRAEPTTLAIRMPAKKNGPGGLAHGYKVKGSPFLNVLNYVDQMAIRP